MPSGAINDAFRRIGIVGATTIQERITNDDDLITLSIQDISLRIVFYRGTTIAADYKGTQDCKTRGIRDGFHKRGPRVVGQLRTPLGLDKAGQTRHNQNERKSHLKVARTNHSSSFCSYYLIGVLHHCI
jgi:hypothetical protein